ncbi:MAG: YebC/PmpR family DNA-binding transcriptional regulator [Saccharofermentanales bacterium]|jgi:YebC/PmpR family DNA-binding regulatory protein|nr:YebC/PmpR family DNA-binding transcriptional regulator [Clostridiaceae bacterium]
MAGHSKWSNIKRRKGAADDKRGKIFSKLGRELQMAVKTGGPDPNINSTLRDAIERAKSFNMPNDSINRSIERAAGVGNDDHFEEVFYEGYGPSGVAVMVRTLTDNRHRTAGDVRHLFDRYGGNLGTDGCVAFQFELKGVLIMERDEDTDDDRVFMDAVDAGAEDVVVIDGEAIEITMSPESYHDVFNTLKKDQYVFAEHGIERVPITWVRLEEEIDQTNMTKLIDALEENDDVQDVYHNWEQDDA